MGSRLIVQLLGRTVESVNFPKGKLELEKFFVVDPLVELTLSGGDRFLFFHEQDCCESVRLEDVAGGSLPDLVGEEILNCYVTSESGRYAPGETFTWTFYTIRTMNRTITLRFLGESNGYYSELVDYILIEEEEWVC